MLLAICIISLLKTLWIYLPIRSKTLSAFFLYVIVTGFNHFGRPFVKRFALCYGTVVLSVCSVGMLRPRGWMDQYIVVAWFPSPRPDVQFIRFSCSCLRFGDIVPAAAPLYALLSEIARDVFGTYCVRAGRTDLHAHAADLILAFTRTARIRLSEVSRV